MNRHAVTVEHIDADDLLGQITDKVVAEIKPLIEAARPPLLVDANEMARLIDVSRATLDRWIVAGIVPSIGDGRLRRFEPAAVIDALRDLGEVKKYG